MSAVWGRAFVAGGRTYGHVIDPRTGEPVEGAWMAAVQIPSALAGDALSTALLVSGAPGLGRLEKGHPGVEAWLVEAGGRTLSIPGSAVTPQNVPE